MDTRQWAEHLASIAAPVLAGTPLDPLSASPRDDGHRAAFIESFRDELGHRRAIDRPLLLHLLGGRPEEKADAGARTIDDPTASLDVRLWWALASGTAEIPAQSSFDRSVRTELLASALAHEGVAPIIGEPAFRAGAIEATTETELGALHALMNLADAIGRTGGDGAEASGRLRERCLDAARWHADTLQPDNGTNHPWAIHVFVALAEADASYAMPAELHAQALLHNAMVQTGRPDRFSACLLLDASRALARG